MGWLFWTLLMWGLWSRVRVLCGCPTPVFAVLNLSAQFLTAVICAFVLGMVTPSHGGTFLGKGVTFDISALCVILGGFVNSCGDHLAATAMSRISPGIAYPLYSGSALLCATILNYVQVGSPNLVMTVCGLALTFTAVFLLSQGERHKSKGMARDPQSVCGAEDPLEVLRTEPTATVLSAAL